VTSFVLFKIHETVPHLHQHLLGFCRRFASRQLSQGCVDDNSTSYASLDHQENLYPSLNVDSAIRFTSAHVPGSEASDGQQDIANSIRERAYLAAQRRMRHNWAASQLYLYSFVIGCRYHTVCHSAWSDLAGLWKWNVHGLGWKQTTGTAKLHSVRFTLRWNGNFVGIC